MKKLQLVGLSLACLATAWSGAARADGWGIYKDAKFGFSMLVPEGTKLAEKELVCGWGMLKAAYSTLSLFAIGKLGEAEKPDEIQKFGVFVTGVDAEHWKLIDEGKDQRGWKWFRTVKAEHAGTVVYGGYGVGAKGSYMVLLKTTSDDYAKHEADYKKWYASVTLQ